MNETVRNYLIEKARKRAITTYREVNEKCNLGLDFSIPQHRGKIGDILGAVSEYEHNHWIDESSKIIEKRRRPLLSAIVGSERNFEQGDGFYRIAERLGYGDKRRLKELAFKEEQAAKCHEFWHNEENYNKYR